MEKVAQRGIEILLALVLVLCLVTLEVLDYGISSGNAKLPWISGGLLVPLILLLGWLIHRAHQVRLNRSAFTRASTVPEVVTQWVLLVIVLVAAALRLYELGTESFWYDEVCTVDLASRPWPESLQTVHPLLFLLTRLSMPLGRSEFALRLVPAMIGIVSIAALHVLGRTIYGRREGLVAAVLLAGSIFAIYHSQELRFYGLQMLFATLTLTFMLRGLTSHRWQDWVGFALATTLNLHSHPFALFVLASEGLYIVSIRTWSLLLMPEVRALSRLDRLRAWLRGLAKPGIAILCSLAIYLPQRIHLFQHPKWVNKLGLDVASSLSADGSTWLSDPAAFWIHGLFGEFTGVASAPLILFTLLGIFLLGLVTSRWRTVLLVLIWPLLQPFPNEYVLRESGQLDDLPAKVEGYRRVWLALHLVTEEEKLTLIEEAMPHSHLPAGAWHFQGLRLLLFETRSHEGAIFP
jgi:uncharacterized membrane protein